MSLLEIDQGYGEGGKKKKRKGEKKGFGLGRRRHSLPTNRSPQTNALTSVLSLAFRL